MSRPSGRSKPLLEPHKRPDSRAAFPDTASLEPSQCSDTETCSRPSNRVRKDETNAHLSIYASVTDTGRIFKIQPEAQAGRKRSFPMILVANRRIVRALACCSLSLAEPLLSPWSAALAPPFVAS